MPDTTTRTTCDASHAGAAGEMGPCILRHHHDGPIHKDAGGTTWWTRPSPTGPSRASIAFTALLVLACLTGAAVALTRGHWGWAVAGSIGTLLLGHELRDETTERRTNHARNHRSQT